MSQRDDFELRRDARSQHRRHEHQQRADNGFHDPESLSTLTKARDLRLTSLEDFVNDINEYEYSGRTVAKAVLIPSMPHPIADGTSYRLCRFHPNETRA